MKTNFKILQNFFILLMMGFSLCAVQACGEDDDEYENEDRMLDNGNLLISGHEAVDLGLSVKWATCNVGASSPEDYGGYYAWGETEGKSNYSWETYKWCNGYWDSMTKYCTYSYDGNVDNKTILDPSDDIATVKWGKKWRIPTIEEIEELKYRCTWTWTIIHNLVSGYAIMGPNGNSIFLPAVGFRDGTGLALLGTIGGYWSTTLYEDYSYGAYGLYFNDSSTNWNNWGRRSLGHTIRPVTDGLLSGSKK